MSKSLNKVMLIGNLGKDPELRFTSSGVPVATFTIATNRVLEGPGREPAGADGVA